MADHLRQQTVLVIDDERGPRESLRILLKNSFNVLCADSVDWGVQLLKESQPDAVVMDIRMPIKTGIEGLREIREIDPTVAVIMLTGFGTLETAQDAIRLGADDYLKKPFDAKEMEDVISRNVHKTQIERRRWRAEKELLMLNQQLQDELGEKERLAALGQKSAELVHDLRNPLTAVLGCSELLAEQLRRDKEKLGESWSSANEYLEMIEKSVIRCKELADMWLALSRRDPQRLKPVLICELLGDVVKSAKQVASGRGVRIDCQIGGTGCEVAADTVQITRALQNVISNAVDAVTGVANGRIHVVCGQAGCEAEIRVEDNGCGMDEEQLKKVFEPFFTTKQVNGTGLGLFITKKVVEDHRGSIALHSKVNEGTNVRIRLPLLNRPDMALAG